MSVKGMMNNAFSGQLLAEKLSKLNNSQQSIETLSHWCIFHRKKAKQVVETWDKLFNSAQKEQRVSFLYLANDILQNSRRKGSEFVNEFWKVLPAALKDVFENNDEYGKKAVSRLVNIWEERKVFGSRGQSLKDEMLGKDPPPLLENNGKISNPIKIVRKDATSIRIKLAIGGLPEKIVTAFQSVHDELSKEDAALGKCKAAADHVEKIGKEVEFAFSQGFVQAKFTIVFWEDIWCGNASLKEQFPNIYRLSNKPVGTVADFRFNNLEEGRTHWGWNLYLRRNIGEAMIEEMEGILTALYGFQLERNNAADRPQWMREPNRIFSVRSFLESLNEEESQLSYFPTDFIWKTKAPTKARILAWLICLRKLNTNENIQKHFPKCHLNPSICVMCREEAETMQHLFWECKVVKNLWRWWNIKHKSFIPPLDDNTFQIPDVVSTLKTQQFWKIVLFTIWYAIWEERNARIFEDKRKQIKVIWERSNALFATWISTSRLGKGYSFGEWLCNGGEILNSM